MRSETFHQDSTDRHHDRPTPPDAAAVPQLADGPATGMGDAPSASPPAPAVPAAGPELRERWRDVQLQFVDDPQAAAQAAQGLVSEAVRELTARQRELDGWVVADGADTERLRTLVRGYRELLDQLTGG